MAPILRTYGKKKSVIKIDKEDTFDKLFKTKNITNIFDSSSERENTGALSSKVKSVTQEKSSLHLPSSSSYATEYFSLEAVLDVTPLTPDDVVLKKLRRNRNLVRVEKFRVSSKKKRLQDQVHRLKDEVFIKENNFFVSSTPLSLKPFNISISIRKSENCISPIGPNTQVEDFQSGSPKAPRAEILLPKNVLADYLRQNSDNQNTSESDFRGFETNLGNESDNFFGFSPSRESLLPRPLSKIAESNESQPDKLTGQKSLKTVDKSNISSILECTSPFLSKRSNSLKLLQLSSKKSTSHTNQGSLSRSMQNLILSPITDCKNIVKSSSFDELHTSQDTDKNSPVCRINVQQVSIDINADSSDIEESAVNSADERSCSLKSGQLDEEESAFHSSDEDNVSGISKDKDSVGFANKSSSKGDSESAFFSGTHKDTSCNNQSGDVSADDCDLYTESEIAKSSDSIEVSRTANVENTSDLSTSSDKEVMKDEDAMNTTASPPAVNSVDKLVCLKQNILNQNSKTYSTKSKDSFYSLDNSASDESELSFESDSELSCESNRSSRKSSLESALSLSKESVEQLRECVSLIKIQDEYEDAICGKSRKSLGKRGSDWECPPSPRRSLFPLAPLFPLPENQEDPGLEEDCGQGSVCESTTASEDDSHHSGSRRSRPRPKDSRHEIEGSRSSGDDDSTKSSPVRETSRLRRSRRISKKKESNCRLNMVVEESDSESTEADLLPQMERIILPTGKKYRRSISILKHLTEDTGELPPTKGRHYDQSVETVIKLQSNTGFESPKDSRKSLLIKRKSLLSQCYTPCESPNTGLSRTSVDLYTSILAEGSPLSSRKAIRKLSCSIREEPDRAFRISLQRDAVLEEEEEGMEEENKPNESYSSNKTVLEDLNSTVHSFSDCSVYTEEEEEKDSDISIQNIIVDYEKLVMRCCQQDGPRSFPSILPVDNWFEESCKVGEGVYGEVFMIPRDNCKNVLKIIPIEGSMKVNDEKQKTYDEISNELLITTALNELRDESEEFMTCGFAELIDCSVVKGRYPKKLVQLWNEFDERKGSDNDSPTIFGKDQLFLVLELGNAGTDLESYSFSTAKQGLSVFKQTVCALAVAEACLEFEHRDLHWGNVLVSRTSERDIPFVLNKEKYTILTNGVKATIIDFTLSRIAINSFPVFFDIGQDPDMFIGAGDYQFDVYRAMKTDVQDRWSSFVPKTNVRWLHYLVDKMIKKVRYQRKTAKVHNDSMKILKEIESWILTCQNSVQVALRVVQYK